MRLFFFKNEHHKEYDDNIRLRQILEEHDPFEPLSKTSQEDLEARILSKLDSTLKYKIADKPWLFSVLFYRGWAMRVGACTCLIILASGFFVGQGFSPTNTALPLIGNLSLVAFADEASGQYLTLTDPSWGDNDDNAE